MDKTALRTAAAKYGTPLYLFDLEAFTARATSSAPLFTPEYRMRSGGMPSLSQIVSSPGEHTSTQRNTSGRPRSTTGLAFME